MRDQTGRAHDEAQERAFRALPWHLRLRAYLMGALATIFVLELLLIAFGWPVLKLFWD